MAKLPKITSLFRNTSLPGIVPGNFSYLRQSGSAKKRIHLRVEADGSAVLLVNANRMYHFNPSAGLMAHLILEDMDDTQSLKKIARVFSVPPAQAAADFAQFKLTFLPIISPMDDPCPICDLNLEILEPFSRQPSAPYRLDLALTYRCNNRCLHCYNEASRAKQEYSRAEWLAVLDRAWQIGIPHVVFTGGEPTLRPDLPDLIAHAESLGLITGLNTNGRLLADPAYLHQLVDAGLDHVQITLESHAEVIHNEIVASPHAWQETVASIRAALATPLFVMTNTTLLACNSPDLAETLSFLAELGVPTIGLNGLIHSGRGAANPQALREDALPALLDIAKAHAASSGQRLIWYTPTQYCHFNPVESGLGVKGCTAARYNMCVEPDGSVLPCQSYYQSLGNILKDEWASIWESELAVSIRERRYAPHGCRVCDLLPACGGGCPLYIQHNPQAVPQPVMDLPF
jgi:radical SAM protein with 4Fe4S-binding SPASM domain